MVYNPPDRLAQRHPYTPQPTQQQPIQQPTPEELLAKKAPETFSASTSLNEKIQRVFNGSMFFIAGAKLLSSLPGFAIVGTQLSYMGFAVINSLSIAQIPAVMTIMTFAPKIIATLAILLAVRKVLAVAINLIIYPAVLTMPYFFPGYSLKEIDNMRCAIFTNLQQSNFEGRRIALNKSGIDYDAFTFEHQTTKDNGRWVIIGGGNGMFNERIALTLAPIFKDLGFNILFVNGPGVGRSSGWPTSYSIQAGQEAGLQYLEKVVKAKKILLYGLSLGGGAQAEAIKNHQFKTDEIDYLVWTDRSFDKLSNAASSIVSIMSESLSVIVKPLFFLLGIELDGIGGAKKLQELGITQIVTQNSHIPTRDDVLPLDQDYDDRDNNDGVIPNRDSLYAGVRRESRRGNINPRLMHPYGNSDITHDGPLPKNVLLQVNRDISTFLATQR